MLFRLPRGGNLWSMLSKLVAKIYFCTVISGYADDRERVYSKVNVALPACQRRRQEQDLVVPNNCHQCYCFDIARELESAAATSPNAEVRSPRSLVQTYLALHLVLVLASKLQRLTHPYTRHQGSRSPEDAEQIP